MQESLELQLSELFEAYLRDAAFEEVEHIPPEFKEFEGDFSLQENCLLVSYDAFDKYYKRCTKLLKDPGSSTHAKMMAADLLLVMNGENEQAWNYKRSIVSEGAHFQREIRFNAAICLKFKKSSIYYDYRLQLIKSNPGHHGPKDLLLAEHKFIAKVLRRFHRNAYCWMYRVKLLQNLCKGPIAKSQLLQTELDLLQELCEANVHDYSAFWHRFNLVRGCLQARKQQELEWVDGLISTY